MLKRQLEPRIRDDKVPAQNRLLLLVETHRPPLPLESNVPGVFAVGDARSGSVKRVGGAIGEGAVVAQLHSYLAASRLQQATQSST
jgi:thioredoxin reductase